MNQIIVSSPQILQEIKLGRTEKLLFQFVCCYPGETLKEYANRLPVRRFEVHCAMLFLKSIGLVKGDFREDRQKFMNYNFMQQWYPNDMK